MKVVFFGTPDFAVYSLKAIAESRHEVVAVVTQPDKPVGRKAVLTPSAVKAEAERLGIKVLQYDKISKEGVSDLKALNADIMVTCAFGQILSQEVLDIAPYGIINVHASILPRYRGASPIQFAVLNGDKETGVTIMKTSVGIDDGDVILCEKTQIFPDETAGELFSRLAPMGAKLIVEALDLIEDGTAVFTPQQGEPIKVRQLKKTDAEIDWSRDSECLHNFVRGMNPWPCAYTFLNGKTLKIFKAKAEKSNVETSHYHFGEVVSADKSNGIKIACGNGFLILEELQAEGSKRMSASEFLNGRKIKEGDRFERC